MSNYKFDLIMNGSSSEHITIPTGYKFLSMINNTDNVIYVYAETRTTNEPQYALVKVPNYTSLTIPIDGRVKYTFFYTDGGGADPKKAEFIYSVENLQINSLLGTQIAGTVTIGADGVGLARQTDQETLQARADLLATEAKQDDLQARADLLATEAKQDDLITALGAIVLAGKTAVKVTSAAGGDESVKATAGKVYGIVAAGAITVILKDGANEVWLASTQPLPVPITCGTSINLNFSAAGDAYVIYE